MELFASIRNAMFKYFFPEFLCCRSMPRSLGHAASECCLGERLFTRCFSPPAEGAVQVARFRMRTHKLHNTPLRKRPITSHSALYSFVAAMTS